MPKFKYSKLVRDKIVDHQIASGARPIYRRLTSVEHKRELANKIVEEATELASITDSKTVASELADVQQAIDDFRRQYGLSRDDIAAIQAQKNTNKGSFSAGIYIDSIELPESDEWVKYYQQNPDRYPEID